MTTPTAPALTESWLELPDGRLFWLSGRCAIGRHIDNTLVLDAGSVSRHHVLLTSEAGGYTVNDLRSSNGTYVNRVPVTRHTALHDGDELRLGDALLRYRCTRRAEPDSLTSHPDSTRRLEDVRERACWLVLADVAGFSRLNAELGGKVALQHLHGWIAGMRPLIEKHGGHINSYVGDAIFAWWPGDEAEAPSVRAALAAVETWRAASPVTFRVIVHHGNILYSRSERGEELSGQEVNFVFRAEKVAKAFGVDAMFSETATRTLHLIDRCRPLGAAPIDGISGRFDFFSPQRETNQ